MEERRKKKHVNNNFSSSFCHKLLFGSVADEDTSRLKLSVNKNGKSGHITVKYIYIYHISTRKYNIK